MKKVVGLNRFGIKYLVTVIFLIKFCFMTNSCATLGISEERKQDLLSKGFPIAVLEVRSGSPNSAGGVDAFIPWQNISEKEIKYVVFIVTPYNRVNDVAPSEIGDKSRARLRDMGPYKPGTVVRGGVYENVWYNHTIKYLVLNGIEVTFMDNSEVSFDAAQATQMLVK